MNITIILIILLAGAIATFLSGDKLASKVALLFALVAVVFSVLLLTDYTASGTVDYMVNWVKNPNMSFALRGDGLSITLLLLNSVLLPVIILVSISQKVKSPKLLYSLMLFMAFAMAGVFLSSDAFLYYIFWELSLIPIYFITVLWGNGDKTKRKNAAMTFFLYTFAGSLFMLAAIIYLYTKAGSFQLEAFYNLNLTHTEQIWIFLAFFLAYAIKTPIFPFHTWQANVYQKAPAVGTMLLAGLMSKMGVFSIIRWQLPITPYAAHSLQWLMLALCIVGVIYGSVVALRQDNLKRFLAYVSLAHLSVAAAGAYALTLDGVRGATILMVAHGFGIVGLFFIAEIIHRRTNTALVSKLGGIKSLAPKFTIAFMLLVLASVAMPLSFNFVGEIAILFGLYQVNVWYAVLVGTSMVLGAFYTLRMYQYVMLGESYKKPFADITLNEGIILTVIIAVIIVFGVYSKPLMDFVTPSLNDIVMSINR